MKVIALLSPRPTGSDRPATVVSILMVNIDNQTPSAFDLAYKAADLDGISFAPETPTLPASGWPTLGNMIDSGKRLVSYLDNGADPSIPYLIDGEFV